MHTQTQTGGHESRRSLLAKKIILDELEALSREKGVSPVFQIDKSGDMVDLAQANESLERNVRRERRRADQIGCLMKALHRLQNGWDGNCADCEKEIPIERIQKVPAVERCVRCESILEKSLMKRR